MSTDTLMPPTTAGFRESREAARERLTREGRWHPFVAYREQLKNQGVKASEAQRWALLMFPPLDGPAHMAEELVIRLTVEERHMLAQVTGDIPGAAEAWCKRISLERARYLLMRELA